MNTNTQESLVAAVKVEGISEFIRVALQELDESKAEVPLTPFQNGQRKAYLELADFFDLNIS